MARDAAPSSSSPVLDAAAIQQVLPHRYPFLLVDRIVELAEDRVVGEKAVTANEPFFQGHFPGRPIMPGVLLVEGIGQTAAAGMVHWDDARSAEIHLAAIDASRFRRPVVPGDRLKYVVSLGDRRRQFVRVDGTAWVDGNEVAEATLTLSIQVDGTQ